MSVTSKIKNGLKFALDKDFRFLYLNRKHKWDNMPDEEFLRRMWRARMGTELNLDNPRTFNEKLQWLKLYDRRPEYTTMVDKVAAKDYVAGIIGAEHIIPTLGVWDDPEDIDFDALPERFVLKCNHNSGLGMCICKDKSALNIEKTKSALRKGLAEDYYLHGREWPYKDVPRKILAEKYMEDSETGELRDYKFFSFDGEVNAMFVATDRQKPGEDVKFDFFDREYNHLPFKQGHENALITPGKPERFREMIEFAEAISSGIPHVRCDFYEANGDVYFGEMTLYHFSGFVPFEPEAWDRKFGDWIRINTHGGGGGNIQ